MLNWGLKKVFQGFSFYFLIVLTHLDCLQQIMYCEHHV